MSTVVTVVKLIDTNKAKLAFLAPLLTAVGASVASWIISGDFNASEIRAAAGGAVLAAVSGGATWLVPAGRAEVKSEAGQSLLEVVLVLFVVVVILLVLFRFH